MRTLNEREKRTVRYAGFGVAIYLVLFGGYKGWQAIQKQRDDYFSLIKQAQDLKAEVKRYDDRILLTKKMMEQFHMDPAKLKRATVVADASAAIQKAAQSSGIQLGPIRETSARPSSKEVATIQFEGSGQVQAAIGLLNRLETCGYPVIIDSVQITPEMSRPGQIKLSLTVMILDFEQWNLAEASHA
jgi:hypothetical protein